ncbi:MAG: DUF2508 domain-containing protein [Oscillospiraceae bacterium]|nr:DUF2508 domain-containing protein [Oscillospiraceae bacterium]
MSRIRERRELRRRFAIALEELEALNLNLRDAYRCFNTSTDPEILEACILEISALHSRRSAALRNIKSMDGDKIKWQL